MERFIMIKYEVLTCFVPFVILLFILNYFYKKKYNCGIMRRKAFLLILFALYIAGVFYFTGSGTIWDGLFKNFDIRYEYINFIPFSNNIDTIGYLLNIVLLIPFGFLVPLIWKKLNKPSVVVGFGFLFSLLIESSQLLNNRSSDIDDLILNTLGTVIGFVIFRLFDKVFKFDDGGSYYKYEMVIIVLVMFIGKFLLFNEYFVASLLYGF